MSLQDIIIKKEVKKTLQEFIIFHLLSYHKKKKKKKRMLKIRNIFNIKFFQSNHQFRIRSFTKNAPTTLTPSPITSTSVTPSPAVASSTTALPTTPPITQSSNQNHNLRNLTHQTNLKHPNNYTTSLSTEKKSTAIQFDWFETETDYNIEAHLLVGIEPNNLRLFIQNHQLIFETKSDTIDDKAFKSDRDTTINVIQRSLYLRRTIDIPKNVTEDSIVAKLSGNTVAIRMPKVNNDATLTTQKDIKFQ